MSAPRLRHRLALLLSLALIALVGVTTGSAAQAAAVTFTNPLNSTGPDPYLTHYNGYYYLMTPQGELLKAVHYLEGRSNPFVLANPALPLIRADFESEKYIWLVKLDRTAQEARIAR